MPLQRRQPSVPLAADILQPGGAGFQATPDFLVRARPIGISRPPSRLKMWIVRLALQAAVGLAMVPKDPFPGRGSSVITTPALAAAEAPVSGADAFAGQGEG